MRRFAAALLLVLATAGCPGDDDCTPGEWQGVFHEATQLDRAMLSAWASGPDDVYLVGGGLGVAGVDALAKHWDGAAWTDLPTAGRSQTLWWVWGAPVVAGAGVDVWMVGEDGLVLRWNGSAVAEVPSGTTATLYGVWGTSSSDVWIVGGNPGAGLVADNDVVLHWDGQTLTRDATLMPKGAALFKVWGAAADDMWVVGELGTLLRHKAGVWMDYTDADLTPYTLLTVSGCSADEVYAVGGQRLLGFDGNSWTHLVDAPLPSQANGVSCGAATVLVVGGGGLKTRFDKVTGTWFDDQSMPPWDTDYHGALVNTDGSLWAVGGNFIAPPDVGARTGVVAFMGCPAPSP